MPNHCTPVVNHLAFLLHARRDFQSQTQIFTAFLKHISSQPSLLLPWSLTHNLPRTGETFHAEIKCYF